ncbi:heme-binding protein 2-like [Haliotis rufescens]|uniref:heme-binding protein 2-like n=1 Tax=Haliotis rufescens TaxID=6454 RepID=UPI00201F150A|nr:heme-binding protein 2-like [Haliotis rufescens]
MELLAVLSVCLLATLSQSASPYLRFVPKYIKAKDRSEWPPKFCNGLSCPKFEVLESVKNEYETREYSQSQWVSTNSAGVDYAEASRTNFMRLFNYISGKNAAGKKIAMTAPVITKIIPGAGPACESNFTMSFFVAVENPPMPTDSKVFLQKLPSLRAYVRSFGGYHMESFTPWLKEAEKLSGFLKNTTYSYITDYYYIGGYDSPFKFLDRHNEVWFIAK